MSEATDQELRDTISQMLQAWDAAPPEVREAALRAAERGARDALLCRPCREQGRMTRATELDHLDGDPRNHAVTNLRPLCKDCRETEQETRP